MANITTQDKEIKSLLRKIKRDELFYDEIPEKYRNDPAVIKAAREVGLRRVIRKGFDIIENKFFVIENINNQYYNSYFYFDNFTAYYEFLQGDIYEDACYYKYTFKKEDIEKYSIDLSRVNYDAFIDYNIDDYISQKLKEERQEYRKVERKKKDIINILAKLKLCNDYSEFEKILSECKNIRRTDSHFPNLRFFLFNYIFHDKENALDFVMRYICNNDFMLFARELCHIYEPHLIVDLLDAQSAISDNEKSNICEYVDKIDNSELYFDMRGYFDECTHFYACRNVVFYQGEKAGVWIDRIFETFDEFARYLENDLSDCDLSKATIRNKNFSKYKINDQTKLPLKKQDRMAYILNKYYDREKQVFVLEINLINIHRRETKMFDYFFDYVHFLKNDLSKADLLFCGGLKNINDFGDINLEKARLRSCIKDILGVKYKHVSIVASESCSDCISNEVEIVLPDDERYDGEYEQKMQKIFYISDIHLPHRIRNAGCKSDDDIIFVVQKTVDDIVNGANGFNKIILIGGDISSDFRIFELFVKKLRITLDNKYMSPCIIFTLGNHELWEFPDVGIDSIVAKYKKMLKRYDMHLLHNNIIFIDKDNCANTIKSAEIKSKSQSKLQNSLRYARVIIFGGIGFAGRNEELNADKKIYRETLDRKREIEESEKFDELYKIVKTNLSDRRVIVFTHMPKRDWNSDDGWCNNFVYVSGHTHKNYFHDDGEYRIYADNQVGYHRETCKLKYFYLNGDYDIFFDKADGVWNITRNQYISFMQGKNIHCDFNRAYQELFMVKKNGYYMFILKNKSGKYIMNGGMLKKLENLDVESYYYEKMDKVIDYINSEMKEYLDYQKQISKAVKSFGGSGIIHGAIVDIDFYNHIYVNPYDMAVVPYYAYDMRYKLAYPNISELLERKCPQLYGNYVKQLESGSNVLAVLSPCENATKGEMQYYGETDIYRASKIISKLQKIEKNILTEWTEPPISGDKKLLN